MTETTVYIAPYHQIGLDRVTSDPAVAADMVINKSLVVHEYELEYELSRDTMNIYEPPDITLTHSGRVVEDDFDEDDRVIANL